MSEPSSDAIEWLSVGAAFTAVADRRPEAIALRWDADGVPAQMTYSELLSRARAVARAILTDMQPRDRLAIWSANSPEWIVAQLGAALAGVVLVPLNPALSDAEAQFVITTSGAGLVLTGLPWRGRDLAAAAAGLRAGDRPVRVVELTHWAAAAATADPDVVLPDVQPDDLMLIQFTSGTTGAPKGAMLSHLVGTNVGPISHRTLGLTEDDVICSPLPFHHVGGSVCTVLATLLVGGTYVVLTRFEPVETLATLDAAAVTFFGGVPTMLIAMLDASGRERLDLPHLRVLMVGGSTVSPALIERVECAFDVEVANGYGQSEAPSSLQTRPGDSALIKATTIGRPNAHQQLAILDPVSHTTVAVGGVGELCLRGPLTMTGYWNATDGDAASTGSLSARDANGWLHTGDLASQDGDGVVTLHGRCREVIIRGGENIYPAEVEAVLVTHPEIADVVVVGAPDAFWGEVPAAFVRARSGELDTADIESFARERLAGFKVPRIWREVTEFPLTASGKVQRFRLVEQLGGA